jgi:hypothetical protein
MQANPSQRSPDEREDKPTQRAVLSLLLHEFPAQVTKEQLRYTLGTDKGKEIWWAVGNLSQVELVWCEGDFLLPTLAARHFDWLELS